MARKKAHEGTKKRKKMTATETKEWFVGFRVPSEAARNEWRYFAAEMGLTVAAAMRAMRRVATCDPQMRDKIIKAAAEEKIAAIKAQKE